MSSNVGFLSSQKSPFPSFPPFLFSLLHHIPVLVKALIVNSAKKKKNGNICVLWSPCMPLVESKSRLPRKRCLGAPWLRLALPLSCFPRWRLKEAVFMGRRVRSQQKLSWANVLLEAGELSTNWTFRLENKQWRSSPGGRPQAQESWADLLCRGYGIAKWPFVDFSLLPVIPSQGSICLMSRNGTESHP